MEPIMIDGEHEHNEELAEVHLNKRFPNSGFEYVGQNYKHWDYVDESGNLFEIKIRSYGQAGLYDAEGLLYEQFKHNKLKKAAKTRGVNFYVICCEPFRTESGYRFEYTIFKPLDMKMKWSDRECNVTTHFEKDGEQRRKVKKVGYLPKTDAKMTFSVELNTGGLMDIKSMNSKERHQVRNKMMESWLADEGYDPRVITPKGYKQLDDLDKEIIKDGWKAVQKLVPLK